MNSKKGIGRELSKILELRATDDEIERLVQLGIKVKKPTKLTLVAAALYEKAQKGDLSAIKEIFTRTEPETAAEGGVILIDDI